MFNLIKYLKYKTLRRLIIYFSKGFDVISSESFLLSHYPQSFTLIDTMFNPFSFYLIVFQLSFLFRVPVIDLLRHGMRSLI